MPEQPAPEPEKQKSDAAAAPKATPSAPGADASRASAYVPLPAATKAKSGVMLALAALIGAGALGGTAVYYRSQSGPPPVVAAAVKQQKTLFVSDKDLSPLSTERVRSAPAAAVVGVAGAAGAAGSMGSGDGPTTMGTSGAPVTMGSGGHLATPAPTPQTPPPAVENRASSPLPVAPPELVNPPASAPQSALTPQGMAAVRSDGYSMFQMQLIDDCAEDGDVVQISVDGVPVSFLSLSHAGATLEIPLKKGESHTITVTATRDGGGGVTLGLRTSIGDVISRNMQVGESETWTIGFK